MSYKIEEIEGIGKAYADKLNEANVFTTDDLLHRAATKHGRQTLAEESGNLCQTDIEMGQPCRLVPHKRCGRAVCRVA